MKIFPQILYEGEGTGSAAPEPAPATPTEPTSEAAATPPPVEQAKPAEKPWYINRIDALTKQLRETQAQAEQLSRKMAAPQAQASPQFTKEQFDQAVNTHAMQLAQDALGRQAFDAQCNVIAEQMDKEFGVEGRQAAAATVMSVCGGLPPALIEALSEVQGENIAGKVFKHLGSNPALLMEVTSLPPVKLASRVAALAGELGGKAPKPKAQTKVPDPIVPQVGASNAGTRALEEITDVGEWMAQRNKEVAEKRGRR